MDQAVKVSTVADILDLPEDSIVHAFKGTITKIGKRRQNKPDDAKEWSFQDLTFRDQAGKQIVLTLKFREEFPKENNGKVFYVLAHHGDRGWVGLKTALDDYNKKKPEVKLEATDRAEIVEANLYEGGAASAPQPAAAQTQAQAPAATQQRAAAPAPTPAQKTQAANAATGPDYPGEIKKVKAALGRMMNLHLLCQQGALMMAKQLGSQYEEVTGSHMSDGTVSALATTLFIELRKQEIQGDRIGDSLPSGPLEKYIQPETKAATPAK